MDRSMFSAMLSYCSGWSALDYTVSAFWECDFFIIIIINVSFFAYMLAKWILQLSALVVIVFSLSGL